MMMMMMMILSRLGLTQLTIELTIKLLTIGHYYIEITEAIVKE